MAPFISIIMPVYNVKNYIVGSIESVLSQTFTDFELLLVDDCSSDGSGSICDEYARKDSRIKVLHLSQNGGAGNARNEGMKAVSGKYLCFFDADDYFDRDILEILAKSVEKNPAKVVIFGIVEEYLTRNGDLRGTKEVCYESKILKDKQSVRNEILPLELKHLYGYPCNKMYDVEYLKSTGALFPRMKFNEDIIFNIDFFMDVDTCNILNVTPYHYVKHTGSTTGSFIPTYFEDIMVKIDRLYFQLEYWGMLNDENLQCLALRYTRYLFSALERNCDKRARMTHKQRKEIFSKEVCGSRFEMLSKHLKGKGIIGIMARALRTKSSFLCLAIGRMIFVVKRFLPKLFTELS